MPNILSEMISVIALSILLGVFGVIFFGFIYIIIRSISPSKKPKLHKNIIEHKHKQRHRAIQMYAQHLGPLLQTKYGKQKTYTPVQVKTTIKEWGYVTQDDCFGLAMYCNDCDFMEYHQSIGESCNYAAMRSEISRYLFGSNIGFDPDSLVCANFDSDDTDRHHHEYSENSHIQHHNHHDYGGYSDSGHHSHQDYGGD